LFNIPVEVLLNCTIEGRLMIVVKLWKNHLIFLFFIIRSVFLLDQELLLKVKEELLIFVEIQAEKEVQLPQLGHEIDTIKFLFDLQFPFPV